MEYSLYGYTPEETGAIVVSITFGIFALIIFYQNLKFKTYFFHFVPVASAMECIGFALRPHSEFHFNRYIVSTLFILLSPTIFALAGYTLTSKIIVEMKMQPKFLNIKIIQYTFLVIYTFCILLQILGRSLTANTLTSTSGAGILLSGLGLESIIFVFSITLLIFLIVKNQKTEQSPKHKILLGILLFDTILLIIRTSYRIAEYSNIQFRNPISKNEKLFYDLDAFEMLFLNILWVPFHPGKIKHILKLKYGFGDELTENKNENKNIVP